MLAFKPALADLQLPSDEVYPIIEEVIAKHGGLPDLQRLGALPSVPGDNYSWVLGSTIYDQIAGYYTDWPNAYDTKGLIAAFKAPLLATCKGHKSLAEERHTRTTGELIVITFDCNDSELDARTVLYFLHFPKFLNLHLFHVVGPREYAAYQLFIDLMQVRLLLQLEEMPQN